ncbi:hypothetical protein C8J56DRAFT_830923 [Mycena floridula]|nr:hypothetical protein C8J56DRAFT_830923 [Mycena floridula]
MTFPSSILFLGATGFVGGEVLQLLAKELPDIPIVAVVRNITADKTEKLQELHSGLTLVEGALSDDAILQEQASKTDVVINCASSDHHASVVSILAGLKVRATSKPEAPIYLHMSGCGITSDNSRGELFVPKKVFTDIGLRLTECENVSHVISDQDIIAAGTRKEHPIRSMIICPSWIYGLSTGLQRFTMPVRLYTHMATEVGVAGTWGRGKNVMNEIHVKDVASAVLTILKAALNGSAFEGEDGIYFAVHPRMVNMYDINRTIGDVFFAKGLVKEPGCKPWPESATAPLGEFGWSLLGGSAFARGEKLAKLGWEPKYTNESSLLDSLRLEVEELAVEKLEAGVRPPDLSGATM